MHSKRLDYFTIEEAYGGSQDWFTNVVMNIGGCGAATACDSCIYFALYMGMDALYPFDKMHLNKEEYKQLIASIIFCLWILLSPTAYAPMMQTRTRPV